MSVASNSDAMETDSATPVPKKEVESMECVGRIDAKAVLQRIYRPDEVDNLHMIASKGKK
jgi:hypothetical protein